MPLNTPNSPSEIEQDAKTDFQREIQNSNPFLPNSWTSAFISGYSNRIYDNFVVLNEAVEASFYDTSPEEFLVRQASWYGITRLPASQAVGSIVVTGTLTTNIPASTEFVSASGITCVTDSLSTITAKSEAPASLVSTGTTATCTLSSSHELSNNVSVTISGANEPEYNGTFDINVINDTTFTYELPSSAASPATGTISADYESALISVTTDDFSEESNLSGGTAITLSGAIAGIDSDAEVYINGLSGGSDIEDIEVFRERFLEIIRNPISHFNVSEIKKKAREIAGVTRVFVQEVTPAVGQVTIYFTLDNEDDIIPSGAIVTNVKNKILEIKPANTSSIDVFVNDPALVGTSTAFTFSALSPNTSDMQTAVQNSLEEFFKTIPEVGTDVFEEQYIAAIQNSVDTNSGQRLTSFSLSAPSGDISVASNEIATLGTVTFP